MPHSSQEIRQVKVGTARLTKTARSKECETELLFGHLVTVLGGLNDKVRVHAHLDGYQGWVLASDLSPVPLEPTHRIRVPHAVALEDRPIQSQVSMDLGMNSLVQVIEADGNFVKIAGAGWVNQSTVCPLREKAHDYVAVAMLFLGDPYGWGRVTGLGIDCSALVQQALYATGMKAPRNSGDQMQALGNEVPGADPAKLKRGDLVFFKGHVVIMVDSRNAIHATDYVAAVVVEPIDKIVERYYRDENKKVLAIKRFPDYQAR